MSNGKLDYAHGYGFGMAFDAPWREQTGELMTKLSGVVSKQKQDLDSRAAAQKEYDRYLRMPAAEQQRFRQSSQYAKIMRELGY